MQLHRLVVLIVFYWLQFGARFLRFFLRNIILENLHFCHFFCVVVTWCLFRQASQLKTVNAKMMFIRDLSHIASARLHPIIFVSRVSSGKHFVFEACRGLDSLF